MKIIKRSSVQYYL